ncbi:ATP-binding protein [Nocardiopsis sp. NPDC050513]|uniref:ATP-binding protein n=1 Tax=Nocardiopsis sp. NPDC050513 TaxID=3364338 RepID=UPI0037955FCB
MHTRSTEATPTDPACSGDTRARALWRLPDTPVADRLARRLVTGFVANLIHVGARDRADLHHRSDLIVSALVANAIHHGQPPIDLAVTWAPSGLRIDVHDRGDGPSGAPATGGEAAPDAESGRGLSLVARTAAHWGIGHRLPYGTHAWAEVLA